MKKLAKYVNYDSRTEPLESLDQSLVANISKEFQRPITDIERNVKVLAELVNAKEFVNPKDYIHNVKAIMREAIALSDLLNELRLFNKLNHQTELKGVEKVNANEIAKDLIVSLENYYPQQKFRLKILQNDLSIFVEKVLFMNGLRRLIMLAVKKSVNTIPLVIFKEDKGLFHMEVIIGVDETQEINNSTVDQMNGENAPFKFALIKRLMEVNHAQLHVDFNKDGMMVFNLQLPMAHQELMLAS